MTSSVAYSEDGNEEDERDDACSALLCSVRTNTEEKFIDSPPVTVDTFHVSCETQEVDTSSNSFPALWTFLRKRDTVVLGCCD